MKSTYEQFMILGRIAALFRELDGDAPKDGALDVERVDVANLGVDPAAYQFRTAVNAEGTDKRLASIKKWDDLRAGVMVVHERSDGSRFVADGHHRIALAKKLGVKGINAFILKESEGHDVESAKALAALVNLSNNNGTGVDAAKLFRSKLRGMNPEQLAEDLNLPKNSAVKVGVALAKLSDDVFGAVVNGIIEERDGAVIGDTFDNPKEQAAALKQFMRIKPANAEESQVLAKQIKNAGFAEGMISENIDIFGDDILETDSVLGERTRIIVALGRAFKKDKSLFETLGINAGKIEQAGNQLSKDANSKLATESAIMQEAIGDQLFTNPVLMKIVNGAALELQKNPSGMAGILASLKTELAKAVMPEPEAVQEVDTQTFGMFDMAYDPAIEQKVAELDVNDPDFFDKLNAIPLLVTYTEEDIRRMESAEEKKRIEAARKKEIADLEAQFFTLTAPAMNELNQVQKSLFDDAANNEFDLIGEGMQIIKRLDESSDAFFDDMSRLREIIVLLGGSKAETSLGDIDIFDKDSANKAISEYIESLHKDKSIPEFMVHLDTDNLLNLTYEIGLFDAQATASKLLNRKADNKVLSSNAFDYFKEKSVSLDGIDTDFIKTAYESNKSVLFVIAKRDPEYQALLKEKNEWKENELNSLVAKKNHYFSLRKEESLGDRVKASLYNEDEFEEVVRLGKEYNKAVDAMERKSKKYDEKLKKIMVDAYEGYNEVSAKYTDDGKVILSRIIEKSAITEEQAKDWASQQTITKEAEDRLKRIGYSPEKVRADMAECYRIMGGKLPRINIENESDRRAKASGIQSKTGTKKILIDGDFNRSTLWHEMGHHLENDPIAKRAANGFLAKRRDSDELHRLMILVPNANYDKTEYAYKDNFINPYIGKYYKDECTEVFSMGLQYLSNPSSAAMFAATDPEMFALITGYITEKLSPAALLSLNVHKTHTGKKEEKKEAVKNEVDSILEGFASGVVIKKDDYYDFDTESAYKHYVFRGQKVEYLGSSERFMVFSGKFKKPNGRMANGFMFIKLFRHGGISFAPDRYDAIYNNVSVFDAGKMMALLGLANHMAIASGEWRTRLRNISNGVFNEPELEAINASVSEKESAPSEALK